jgi:hypothetical protein
MTFLHLSQTNNEAKKEPEKKKQKLVRSKGNEQKVTGIKSKEMGNKKQKKSIAVRAMEKSHPNKKVLNLGQTV